MRNSMEIQVGTMLTVAMLGTNAGTLLVQARRPDADGQFPVRQFGLEPATEVRG